MRVGFLLQYSLISLTGNFVPAYRLISLTCRGLQPGAVVRHLQRDVKRTLQASLTRRADELPKAIGQARGRRWASSRPATRGVRR